MPVQKYRIPYWPILSHFEPCSKKSYPLSFSATVLNIDMKFHDFIMLSYTHNYQAPIKDRQIWQNY